MKKMLVLIAVFSAGRLPALAATRVIERVIARVNNEIITQRQFERERARLREELAQRYSGPELEAQVREQSRNLLRDLIDQSLMVQKAKDLDINVETDLVKELDRMRQANHLATLQDLEKAVENEGLIWEDFQDRIRRQLLMQRVIEREVGGRIIITRADARQYFEAHKEEFASPGGVHLAEILISLDKHKPEEAEKLANQAAAELKAGARWDDVVKKYSDDTKAGPQGDVGFFKEGTLAPAIAGPVAKLDVNETSPPIQTKYGFVIVKVLERRTPGTPRFDEVEQRVDEAIYMQRMQPALRDYLANLRKESYVYVAPGYVDTGAPQPSASTALDKNP
jgi:peptidyl-prolyl cis-trans isomerase SurA